MGDVFKNRGKLIDFIRSNYYVNPKYAFGDVASNQNEFRQHVLLWAAWYKGYDSDFHDYHVYNGQERVEKTRKQLRMGKTIAEDWADLLINEQVDISVKDEGFKKTLDDILEFNGFHENINGLIEKTFALGTGALVEFKEFDDTVIEFLSVENVVPITIVGKKVVDCAFASTFKTEEETQTYLNVHILVKPITGFETDDELEVRRSKGISDNYHGYIIENKMLNYKNDSWIEIDLPEEEEEVIITNSLNPRFQIIKPAKENNLSFNNNGLGMSIYSNALNQLQDTDIIYDSFINEFELGISKMFVHDELAKIDVSTQNGKTVFKPLFDHKVTTFYAFDMGKDAEKIKHIQSELRVDEHVTGLNKQLNTLGKKCNLGNDFYKFENGAVKTVAEVMSNNAPLYKSVNKQRKPIQNAIIGMVKAIAELNGISPDQEIKVNFDDSIFEDTSTIRKEALLELNAGVIDQIEYFMRVYKMSEEAAQQKVDKMNARKPKEVDVDDMVTE